MFFLSFKNKQQLGCDIFGFDMANTKVQQYSNFSAFCVQIKPDIQSIFGQTTCEKKTISTKNFVNNCYFIIHWT